MARKKSKIHATSLSFRYDIIIHSVAGGLPTDETALLAGLLKLGYELLPQQKNPSVQTLKKSNSILSINIRSSMLSIETQVVTEINPIVDDIYDVLETECAFDTEKYPILHQLNATMTLRDGNNPFKNINKVFTNKKGTDIVNSIFETSLKNQGVKLSLGDPFGKEYFQLIIEPRVIYSDSEYYITTLYRNSLEKTQDFTTNLTNNITTILDKLASS
ncbi:MAG: hypothetical protein IIC67_04700 [Thaumarchaeota archaeon]|nr:hypothetical protein [Nitrososphaerota archaeon]